MKSIAHESAREDYLKTLDAANPDSFVLGHGTRFDERRGWLEDHGDKSAVEKLTDEQCAELRMLIAEREQAAKSYVRIHKLIKYLQKRASAAWHRQRDLRNQASDIAGSVRDVTFQVWGNPRGLDYFYEEFVIPPWVGESHIAKMTAIDSDIWHSQGVSDKHFGDDGQQPKQED